MDSLNGASNGCNFIVNPTCVTTQTNIYANNNMQVQTQHQTVSTTNPYFNSFNNNVFNADSVSPMYI